MRHRERRKKHRDQRDEKRSADETLLGVDRVGQPGVSRPRPPERAEHEHAATDPREGRVVREQGRHLREREHEDQVKEEFSRGDAMLLLDCRRGHPLLEDHDFSADSRSASRSIRSSRS